MFDICDSTSTPEKFFETLILNSLLKHAYIAALGCLTPFNIWSDSYLVPSFVYVSS